MKSVSMRSFVCISMLAGLLVGCAQPPRGSSGGRIDTSVTTGAESLDPRVLPVALMEFSDQASRDLAQDLSALPEIGAPGAPGGRSVVILGDINNKTGNVATSEFEMTKSRIRNNLLQSRYARSKLQWVENRARLANIAAREGVGTDTTPAGPDAYDPRHTFTLNMDVFRINRGPVNQYYMEAQLVSFANNEIIFSKRYEVKQVQSAP